MKSTIIKALKQAITKMGVDSEIELTPSKEHGDFSTNIAMKLTRTLKQNPRLIAEKIIDNFECEYVKKVTVDGPGFINIFLNDSAINQQVEEIIKADDAFGKLNQGKYINVEYVSANPTGYLHIGHAKNAAVGSALINILRCAGNKVDSEYYINDAGTQINILGRSVYARYQQLFNNQIGLPEDSYHGQDIIEVASKIKDLENDKFLKLKYEEVANYFENQSKQILFNIIKNHLEAFKVKIDNYYSEKSLYENNLINPTLHKLKNNIFLKDGATWLSSKKAGDDKDRVLIKKDGKYTYFLPDIAYHKIKIDRGYDELINIWGADHIGYIKRLEIALGFLGLPSNCLDILVVQLVKLFRDGQEVKMSKRKGTAYQLIELIEEVGSDAARWFMLEGALNSELIFDLNKAVLKNNENPVFFVQYSHARANQLFNKLNFSGKGESYKIKEVHLIKELSRFPEVIKLISQNHKVNLLPQYLLSIARLFNSWYSNTKALGSENEVLLKKLVQATKIVLRNGLTLLGISAPNKM